MKTDFFIFRHGQSSYNVAGRVQGQTNDSILTELGQKQAVEIGQKLCDRGIEIIVTSPLKRAIQTAELANKSLNVPIKCDEHFIEVNVGKAEGLHYTEVVTKYPEIFEKMHALGDEFDDVAYPGGETKKQVRERVFDGLDAWDAVSEYKTIAISSHGIMLAQISAALGVKSANIENGAILHIKKENNLWSIIEWL